VKRRHEVLVGVAVILGLALIVFGTFWLQGRRLGREQRTIVARFDEAGQILRGNSVKLRGVLIGRVEKIELEPSGAGVLLTMSIDPDVKLPEDPVVILAPESMFGDWQAQISPRSTFPQYAYSESPDPNVLPGFSLPDLSRLTAVADEIAGNLSQLTGRFETAFTEETARNVRQAIQNIETVSSQLNGLIDRQQKNADEVAANLQTTSKSLGEAAETARRAFAELEVAVGGGRLTAVVDNIQRATAQTDSLAGLLLETSRQVKTTAITTDSAMRSVGTIARSIQRGEGSLGKLVNDTALYFRLTESSREMQLLLRDIRANPGKYINLRVF
jgi:phospholipid/cholesterol/gamma-HCH transport system substrate-binding protein